MTKIPILRVTYLFQLSMDTGNRFIKSSYLGFGCYLDDHILEINLFTQNIRLRKNMRNYLFQALCC